MELLKTKYFAIKCQKLRDWLSRQSRSDEDRIDVLTMLLALRCGCHDERTYTRWTLAAALVLVVSAVIIALGNIFFWPFYENLP